jgi:small subunit ribosomal protein S16
MLAIRMQRTGRKGHAMFRVVVQDSRTSPTSGKVIALLGNYDPHLKTSTIAKDQAKFFLEHGAHPSERVAKLLKDNDVKLPKWVQPPTKKQRSVRNPDKLAKAETPAPSPVPEVEPPAEANIEEAPADTVAVEPAAEVESPDAAEVEPAETEAKAEPAEAEVAEPTVTDAKAEPAQAAAEETAEASK